LESLKKLIGQYRLGMILFVPTKKAKKETISPK